MPVGTAATVKGLTQGALEELGADQALSEVPVVVFTGRELSAEEDARLHTMARSIVVKGVESPERLLDETALFLHRVVTELPPEKQRMLERLTTSAAGLIAGPDVTLLVHPNALLIDGRAPARADLATAENNRKLAGTELQRAQRLLATQFVSRALYDQMLRQAWSLERSLRHTRRLASRPMKAGKRPAWFSLPR